MILLFSALTSISVQAPVMPGAIATKLLDAGPVRSLFARAPGVYYIVSEDGRTLFQANSGWKRFSLSDSRQTGNEVLFFRIFEGVPFVATTSQVKYLAPASFYSSKSKRLIFDSEILFFAPDWSSMTQAGVANDKLYVATINFDVRGRHPNEVNTFNLPKVNLRHGHWLVGKRIESKNEITAWVLREGPWNEKTYTPLPGSMLYECKIKLKPFSVKIVKKTPCDPRYNRTVAGELGMFYGCGWNEAEAFFGNIGSKQVHKIAAPSKAGYMFDLGKRIYFQTHPEYPTRLYQLIDGKFKDLGPYRVCGRSGNGKWMIVQSADRTKYWMVQFR